MKPNPSRHVSPSAFRRPLKARRILARLAALLVFVPLLLRAEDKSIQVRQKGATAWALIVSTQKYNDDGIPELTWPDQDGADLDRMLTGQGYTRIVLSTSTTDLKKL